MKRKFTEMEEGCDPARCKKIDWDRTKSLVIRGNAESGKTNWALAQFERPCMIEDIESLQSLHRCGSSLLCICVLRLFIDALKSA